MSQVPENYTTQELNNDVSPLDVSLPEEKIALSQDLINSLPWLDDPDPTPLHRHHFTYQLNANHTAFRGCWCGLAFVGHMVGVSPDQLVWHQVHEVEQ